MRVADQSPSSSRLGDEFSARSSMQFIVGDGVRPKICGEFSAGICSGRRLACG